MIKLEDIDSLVFNGFILSDIKLKEHYHLVHK